MPYYIYIILAVIVVLIFEIIKIYNTLVRGRQQVEEAKSGISVQQKRRYDLIPNLVETVKGYAGHERSVFENVTQARAKAMGGGSVKEQQAAENMLTQALKSLFAVAENYPQLKANENFSQLQGDLTDAENKIQQARDSYNAAVREFNTRVESFPYNFVAREFRFLKYEFFETGEEASRQPVAVKF